MKNLNALVLLLAGATSAASFTVPARAQDTAPSSPVQKPAKNVPAKNKKSSSLEDKEPDISGLKPIDFHCELGNKLTIYSNANDDQQIALRWNKRLHQLMRVSTTTGANRFENAKKGLVWIGIPAKGMLLDSKKGQQLANECKSAEQRAEQKS